VRRQGKPKYENTIERWIEGMVWTGRINFDPNLLERPARWRERRRISVNSVSDMFHENIPLDWIKSIFTAMVEAPQHQYQILTKRADRLEEVAPHLPWPPFISIGVSVESADYLWRIDHLRKIPAATKFLMLEPLLGPLDGLDLTGIDWVIVGGEFGPRARPMEPDWVRSIRDTCLAARVPVVVKQWGGTRKKEERSILDARWDELQRASFYALPKKTYDIVYADPPWWYYSDTNKNGAAGKHYPLMPDDELRNFPMRQLMADRSILFVWATSPRLDLAMRCIESWGLHFRGVSFTWIKTRKDGRLLGASGVRPSIVKPTTEYVLAASPIARGKPLPLSDEAIQHTISAPRREHSRKPDEVQERVEKMYPDVRRIELFARRRRLGWDSWGGQLPD
jgi:protein gp37/N6-adenosine-specific RNA methylase IME4